MSVNLNDNIARHTARIYRRQVAIMNRRLESYQLGSGRYPYLLALYEQDGRPLGELASLMLVDKAAATRAIDKLVETEYVVRAPDPDDGRLVRVFLTDRGCDIRPKLEKVVEEVLALMEEGLAPEERTLLKKLMGQVAENVSGALEDM